MSLRMKVIIPCRWDLPEEHGLPVLERQGSIWAYWWCATLCDSRTRQSYNQRKYCWSCDPCSWINKVENIIASDLSVGILTSECLWIRKGTFGGYPILQYHRKKLANTETPCRKSMKYLYHICDRSCLPSAACYYWLLLIQNIAHVHLITFVFQYKI